MKIKKYHGNVTILTLFVLLASALMGVLVALYMKNFIRYSDEITSYEKTNYLAKAGTELGLAIVGSREVGLVYSIDSGDSIKLNFECPFPVDEGEECPVDPKFSLQIDGLGHSYQNCDTSNLVDIKPGLSAIIPLYKDPGVNGVFEALESPNESSLMKRNLSNLTAHGNGTWNYGVVWMFNTAEEENILHIDNWKGPLSDAKKENPEVSLIGRNAYYIAANPQKAENDSEIPSKTQKICITDDNGGDIPQETVKIVSIGYYNNRQLGTETLATKALPSFLQGDNYIYNTTE